jgi:hypothetical protein
MCRNQAGATRRPPQVFCRSCRDRNRLEDRRLAGAILLAGHNLLSCWPPNVYESWAVNPMSASMKSSAFRRCVRIRCRASCGHAGPAIRLPEAASEGVSRCAQAVAKFIAERQISLYTCRQTWAWQGRVTACAVHRAWGFILSVPR